MSRSRQKIALCANTSWSLYNFRLGLIRTLLAKEIQVYVLAPRDGYTAKLIAEGASYVPIPLESYSSNPIADLRLLLELYRVYRKEKFDHIIHYTAKPNIYGSLAASFTKTPSIAVFTGLGRIFHLTGVGKWIIRGLLVQATKRAEQIWFLNEENKGRFFNEINLPVQHYITHVLPSEGINTRRFSKRLDHSIKPFLRILFAGRMLLDKGVFEYVEAAKQLKQVFPFCKFELLGMIDYTNDQAISLDQIMQWHNQGVVHYLGSTEDVRLYLDRSDMLVFPSYYEEGVSRILLEAASMELPIITTRHTGCREVVAEGVTGLLCEPRSVEDLVDKMYQMILMSPEARVQMGQRGREYVKTKYEETEVINQYLEKLSIDKWSTKDKKVS